MLVKLTNNFEGFRGLPLWINTDHVTSVFEIPTDSGSLITAVFCSPSREWHVEEGLSEVIKLINGVKK